MRQKLTTLIFSVLFVSGALAQELDSLPNGGAEATVKPRIGFGIGTFTFLGDVQDDFFKPELSSSFGFEVQAARNLSKSFDIELRVLFGDIKINPRKEKRDYNFHTIIWNGSANLLYNFNNFYKKPAFVRPFISVGVAYLGFDSKTDMFSANGQLYHYWSDGSVRDLAQDDPLANLAVFVAKDYEYETDLRQMNLDGLGKYNRSSISLPGTVGFNFRLSPRVTMRVSSSYYYNFTDLVDNISDAGVGARKGNSANDNFLYHSFSLSYNLWKEEAPDEADIYEALAFDDVMAEDSDGDGIKDIDDMCAETPNGVDITPDGCPKDSDDDGVADFMDKELKTPIGQSVDVDGVAINYERLSEQVNDSIVPLNRKLLTDKLTEAASGKGKKYTVHVGTFTDKIPDELKAVLRSISGLREHRINDTLTIFTADDYDNFDDAEEFSSDLRKMGVDQAFGVKSELVNDIAKELDQLEKGSLKTTYLYFRIEFDEYREKISFDKISSIIASYGIHVRESAGGLKTYSVGKFNDYFAASKVARELSVRGVGQPRVAPYLNGKPITIEEALDLFEKPAK